MSKSSVYFKIKVLLIFPKVKEKEYGGYLPLEIPFNRSPYYSSNNNFSVLPLNSGRSAFYYAALSAKIRKIYLPLFNCINTASPFEKLGIEIKYYKLDNNLLPKDIDLKNNEFLLWTNYYGNASDDKISKITKQFPNLIIDNCHAFFSKPIKGFYNCYSTRKFFGVSDGAYLIKDNLEIQDSINCDTSYQNSIHLFKQIDLNTNSGYQQNLENEERLNKNYLRMSILTSQILSSINYKNISSIRRRNFLKIHSLLGSINQFPVNLESKTHIYYPFLVKDENLRFKLIKKKLYNPFLWKHIIEMTKDNEIENQLSKYTVLLPIDQRYSLENMQEIFEIVKKCLV